MKTMRAARLHEAAGGGYPLSTVVHELGHIIGIGHGDWAEETWRAFGFDRRSCARENAAVFRGRVLPQSRFVI